MNNEPTFADYFWMVWIFGAWIGFIFVVIFMPRMADFWLWNIFLKIGTWIGLCLAWGIAFGPMAAMDSF